MSIGVQAAAISIATGKFDIGLILKCINWTDVVISAGFGLIGPTVGGNYVGYAFPKLPAFTRNAMGPATLTELGQAQTASTLWKFATPNVRIGDECDCKGLGAASAMSKILTIF